MIAYFYDETGSPIGMAIRTRTSATTTLSAYQFTYYLFTKNLQGDIVGIYTSDGAKVAEYRYDAWGNHTVYDGNGAAVPSTATSFIGNINPFRYRGYYFDTESGFYYLNSRYYDPQVKRFISADDISYLGANGDLNSFNLYAYCSNNPVMCVDPTGHVLGFVGSVIVGGAALLFMLFCVTASVPAEEKSDPMDLSLGQYENQLAGEIDKSHPNEYTVYTLLDPDTKEVAYVGRTKNYQVRMEQHSKKGGKTYGMIPGPYIENLTYTQARGLEQIGILACHTMYKGKNSINGISPKNKNLFTYMWRGYNYLYNQVTNEIYNLFGK